jgi:Arf-GAP domain and FG repeat-containing protein 1
LCKKTWLGLWNSANSPEPESRDEQKVKDFMIQKYERRRWYIPPQQANVTTTTNSVQEAKPLKLLGKDAQNFQVSSIKHLYTC